MNNDTLSPVIVERAIEQLRQERETFNQQKKQDNLWFGLRMVMGIVSIFLLISVIVIASYILLNSDKFSSSVVTSAGVALFVDILGLLISVWKITLNPKSMSKLQPVLNSIESEE